MPISYHIDEKAGIAYFIPAGTTTEPEWVETRSRVKADPRYQPGMSLLIDARRHETLLSREFLTKVAASPMSRSRPGHVPSWAIVVSRQVNYGLGRMFSLLAEPNRLDVRVFRDIGEAESWLRDVRMSQECEPAEPNGSGTGDINPAQTSAHRGRGLPPAWR